MNNVVELKPAEDRFEEFWGLFPSPRRCGKAVCKAKWDAITTTGLSTRTKDRDSDTFIHLNLKATPDEIIEGLERNRKLWEGTGAEKYGWKDGGRFIPMPATWLNRGGWQD